MIDKPKKETGGIEITPTEGELAPPLKEEVVEEIPEVVPPRPPTKIPLSPAVIKPPLRFEGQVLSELTGYTGWLYTEEDLEDIANLIEQCGWEVAPQIQILIALLTLHGVKYGGYLAWKRAGRPGDLKKKKEVGEMPREAKPGEEVKI